MMDIFILLIFWPIASIAIGCIFAGYYLHKASLTDDPLEKKTYYGMATAAFIDGVMFSNPYTGLPAAACFGLSYLFMYIGWTDRPYTFGSLIVRLCDIYTGVEAERYERMYRDVAAWLWMREVLGYNIMYVGDYP